jgi:O-antigen/teichoic acid export membrane protein
MRRVLTQTVIIQSFGMALILSTTLFVSRIGGPDAQGGLALVKSISDLQVAICSLGLPSGIVYVLNKTGQGHRPAFRISLLYALFLIIALTVLDVILLHFIRPESGIYHLLIQAALFGSASGLATGYALQRGIVLVQSDSWAFSLLSVLPAVVIATTVVLLLRSTPFAVELAYAISGLLCLTASTLYLRVSLGERPNGSHADVDWSTLRQQSLNVFLQGIIFGFQVFLTNAWLESIDATLKIAGLFAIASMVITLPNQLIAMVAPVLFNRWSKMLDWRGYRVIRRNSALLALGGQTLGFLSIPLVGVVLGWVFGTPFLAAQTATMIMLTSLFAVITGRILTPALQGLGCNWIVTLSGIARFLVGSALAATVYQLYHSPLTALAVGWVVGEYAALAILIFVPMAYTQRSGDQR